MEERRAEREAEWIRLEREAEAEDARAELSGEMDAGIGAAERPDSGCSVEDARGEAFAGDAACDGAGCVDGSEGDDARGGAVADGAAAAPGGEMSAALERARQEWTRERDALREALDAERARGEAMALRLGLASHGVAQSCWERYERVARAYLDGQDEGARDAGAALEAALRDFPPQEAHRTPRVVAEGRGAGGGASWKALTLGERMALYQRDADAARRMAREAGERLER